jgi:hypothetical protein
VAHLDPLVGTSTYALADQFEFVERVKRSQRLPPRGLFRVVVADVRGQTTRRHSHTLFFASLLAAPLYHELIAAHYTLPAPGKHGPFNIADLAPADYTPITADELVRRVGQHLDYRRYGSAPIAAERRRNVTDYVESLAAHAAPTEIHALAPCEWFSAPTNTHYPHEWSHALLEYREYVLFDTLARQLICLMFAFD